MNTAASNKKVSKPKKSSLSVQISSDVKTETNGRAFVVLEDGCIQAWDEYSLSTGSGMKQNIFPKHAMSVVLPQKTLDVLADQMNPSHGYFIQRGYSSNDSFNIRCFVEPGIRKSFDPSDYTRKQKKNDILKNYRCFDIKRWK
jgi:sRNA-binding regulator protein Hfq